MTPTELISQNIAAVVMAGLFLWYIGKRDKLIQDIFDKFADKLDKLTDALEKLEKRIHHVETKRTEK